MIIHKQPEPGAPSSALCPKTKLSQAGYQRCRLVAERFLKINITIRNQQIRQETGIGYDQAIHFFSRAVADKRLAREGTGFVDITPYRAASAPHLDDKSEAYIPTPAWFRHRQSQRKLRLSRLMPAVQAGTAATPPLALPDGPR